MILYDNEMSWGHGDGYVVLWVPMEGLVIEAAYEETIIHSIGLFGRCYLEKSGWGVVMMHHPCSTYPGQHQYGHSI